MSSGATSIFDLASLLVSNANQSSLNLNLLHENLQGSDSDHLFVHSQVVWKSLRFTPPISMDEQIDQAKQIATIALRLQLIYRLRFAEQDKVKARNKRSGAIGTYMWTRTHDENGLVLVNDCFGRDVMLDPIMYSFSMP